MVPFTCIFFPAENWFNFLNTILGTPQQKIILALIPSFANFDSLLTASCNSQLFD